jgi:hypothetical protein
MLYAYCQAALPANAGESLGTLVAPANWQAVRSDIFTSEVGQWVYEHRYVAGDPTSWQWIWNNAGPDVYPGCTIIAVANVVSGFDSAGGNTGMPYTNIVAPAITTHFANDLLLTIDTDANGWDALNPPSDMTNIVNTGNGNVASVESIPSPSTTAQETATGDSGYWAAEQIAIH